jgi:mannose-6-phosphate isomerase-like protein (cupin superfamily)
MQTNNLKGVSKDTMIKRRSEMPTVVRQMMMNGTSAIRLLHILGEEELGDSCRLFSRVSIGQGSSIGGHSHRNEREVYYILRGRGVADHNGETVTLEEGDVMMIGDGMSHAIRNDDAEDLEFLAVILVD